MKKAFLIILKVLLTLFIINAVVIIFLHSQVLPFILFMLLALVAGAIYYKQKKQLKTVTQQKDVAQIQLQAGLSAPSSEVLYNALSGIQAQIIQNEVNKSVYKTPERIMLPLFNEIRYVNISDIIRCEADNTYTIFKLKDSEEILISKTLKEYSDLLADKGFIRTHQSHLVNLAYVKSWLREDGGCLLLHDGSRIPVSKLNKENVKAKLSGSA